MRQRAGIILFILIALTASSRVWAEDTSSDDSSSSSSSSNPETRATVDNLRDAAQSAGNVFNHWTSSGLSDSSRMGQGDEHASEAAKSLGKAMDSFSRTTLGQMFFGASNSANNAGTPTGTASNAGTPTGTASNAGTPTGTATNAGTPTGTANNAGTPTGTATNAGTPTGTASNAGNPTGTLGQGPGTPGPSGQASDSSGGANPGGPSPAGSGAPPIASGSATSGTGGSAASDGSPNALPLASGTSGLSSGAFPGDVTNTSSGSPPPVAHISREPVDLPELTGVQAGTVLTDPAPDAEKDERLETALNAPAEEGNRNGRSEVPLPASASAPARPGETSEGALSKDASLLVAAAASAKTADGDRPPAKEESKLGKGFETKYGLLKKLLDTKEGAENPIAAVASPTQSSLAGLGVKAQTTSRGWLTTQLGKAVKAMRGLLGWGGHDESRRDGPGHLLAAHRGSKSRSRFRSPSKISALFFRDTGEDEDDDTGGLTIASVTGIGVALGALGMWALLALLRALRRRKERPPKVFVPHGKVG